MYYIGIDVGTSGTKTVLFDGGGRPLCSKTIGYEMYQPRNGWAEQDPDDWWQAARDGLRHVVEHGGVSAHDIKGVGLSGQMHGLVMLDHNGNVLRQAIIWCDQRTDRECAQMEAVIGRRRIIEITANPPMTGFTAAKILWVQNNEPQVYEKCKHILLPKDYIRYKLTGEYATDVSDAAGMQLMNIACRDWSDEILGKLNIDRRLLGDLYESQDITGRITKEASVQTGLGEGTIVVGGAGDNPAAALGTGVAAAGSAFTTIGTSAVIYAVTDEVKIDLEGRVHTLCASVPGKWTVMSCTQAAGLSLRWLRDHCCGDEVSAAKARGIDVYDMMSAMAETIPPGADRLLFLPYLMGERSPHPDPNCRGAFVGLSAMHTRAHLIRAVMEGVAYSQRECLDVFKEMGVTVDGMTVCGGGSRSALWRQMLADLYACPVDTLAVGEGGALGAALLAGVGAGEYASVQEACAAVVKKNEPCRPDMEAHARYQPYYEIYKELYLSLKENFIKLSKVN